MSRSELLEHAGYFRDRSKIEAYERALTASVRPGDVVVDLGAGTGLLGFLAARAGASRVYMLDSGPILGLATELASRNGLDEVMVPVRGHSQEVVLPELADVIVCDQIGGLVYDAGVLEYFADARARLLKPGGRMVPLGFELFCAPVSAPGPRGDVDVWAEEPWGIDAEPAHQRALNTEWRVDAADVAPLTEAASLGRLSSWSRERIAAEVDFTFDAPGTVDGILGWFDAELAPGVHLSNSPDRAGRMDRWCNFYATPESFPVVAGDTLAVRIDLRPDPGMLTWTTTWRRGRDTLAHGRQSTVLGQFLGPEDLLAAGEGTLQPTPAERRGRRGPRSCGRGHDGGRDHRPGPGRASAGVPRPGAGPGGAARRARQVGASVPVIHEVYGLRVASEVPLPLARHALPEGVDVDVEISAGLVDTGRVTSWAPVPEAGDGDEPWLDSGWDPDGTVLSFWDLTARLDGGGRHITVEAADDVDAGYVAHIVLDHVLPRWLYLHGDLVLHAGAVVLPSGRAAAFLGATGQGKSSLVTALAGAGWPLLGDDACRVVRRDGRWWAVPSYPGVRLNARSRAALAPAVASTPMS